jgi:hypothetical protein
MSVVSPAALADDSDPPTLEKPAPSGPKELSTDTGTPVLLQREQLFPSEPVVISGSEAYQGGVRLQGEDFYLAVGRPDLRDRYRQRSHTKTGALVVSGVILAGGLVWGLGDLFVTSFRNSQVTAGPSGGSEASPVPWLVALLGPITALAVVTTPTDPVSEAARQQLVREHNQRVGTGTR